MGANIGVVKACHSHPTRVWERRGFSPPTKRKVYRAVELSTLLYVRETWTVYSIHAKQLDHFLLSCLYKVFHIRWQNKFWRSCNGLASPASTPSYRKLKPDGLIRMPDSRLPTQLLHGELCRGMCSAGEQKKRFETASKCPSKT